MARLAGGGLDYIALGLQGNESFVKNGTLVAG